MAELETPAASRPPAAPVRRDRPAILAQRLFAQNAGESSQPSQGTSTSATSNTPPPDVITVNPDSQLTAAALVQLIQDHPKIPQVIKDHISLVQRDGRGAIQFDAILDSAVPQGESVPGWSNFVIAASAMDEWEFTTGNMEFSGQGNDEGTQLKPDLENASNPEHRPGTFVTSQLPGETNPQRDWVPIFGLPISDIEIKGETIPSDRMARELTREGRPPVGGKRMHPPRRGLIVVANRASSREGSIPNITQARLRDAVVETFFHEVGVHAGAASARPGAGFDGRWQHPHASVNQRDTEIDNFFHGVTTSAGTGAPTPPDPGDTTSGSDDLSDLETADPLP